MEDKRVVFYIIVPVYNSERFLRRCITSIIQQSFSDYKLILIDDGSTDSSGAICDSFASENNNVTVIHQTNKGQILARLAGIEYAKKDAQNLLNTEPYVVFADSDDSLKTNALEKIHNAIAENNYADLIIYGYDKISESGMVLEKYNPNIYFSGYTSDKHTILTTITAKVKPNYCSLWSKAVKLSLMNTDYDEELLNLKFGEDAIQSYDLFNRCKDVFFLNISLYNYTINRSSISFKIDKRKGIEDILLMNTYITRILNNSHLLSKEEIKPYCIDAKRSFLSKLSGVVNSSSLTKKEKLQLIKIISENPNLFTAFPQGKTYSVTIDSLAKKNYLKSYWLIKLWSLGQFFKFAYIKPKNAIMAFIRKDR